MEKEKTFKIIAYFVLFLFFISSFGYIIADDTNVSADDTNVSVSSFITIPVKLNPPVVKDVKYEPNLINVNNTNQEITILYDRNMNTEVEPKVILDNLKEGYEIKKQFWKDKKQFILEVSYKEELMSEVSIEIMGAESEEDGLVQETYKKENVFSVDTLRPKIEDINFSLDNITDNNLTQLVTIKFSEDMDTSINPEITFNDIESNYEVIGEWVGHKTYKAKVTFTDADEVSEPSIIISDAKDYSDNTMLKYKKGSVFYIDTENPYLVSASATGDKQITLQFNEPVSVLDFKKINCSDFSILIALQDISDTTFVYLVLNKPLENTAFTSNDLNIYKGAIKDKFNNINIDSLSNFISDGQKPLMEVSVIKSLIKDDDLVQTIKLKFSEDMDTSINPKITFNGINNTDIFTNGTWGSEKSYKIDINLTDDDENAIAIVDIYDAEDTAGNKINEDKSKTFTVDTKNPIVTVDTQNTIDHTPKLTGTVDDDDATIIVTVDDVNYSAINNKDGTWSLSIDNTLEDGTYDVSLKATDSVGNIGVDSTTNELRIYTRHRRRHHTTTTNNNSESNNNNANINTTEPKVVKNQPLPPVTPKVNKRKTTTNPVVATKEPVTKSETTGLVPLATPPTKSKGSAFLSLASPSGKVVSIAGILLLLSGFLIKIKRLGRL